VGFVCACSVVVMRQRLLRSKNLAQCTDLAHAKHTIQTPSSARGAQ